MKNVSMKDIRNLLNDLVSPVDLLKIKNVLVGMPDEHLQKYKVFRFCWGDEEGYCDWKRKETPKQYARRIKLERAKNEEIKGPSRIRTRSRKVSG